MFDLFKNWKKDVPASLVVYLVALPLCLGVALASLNDVTKLSAGLLSGIIGGIVVGLISNSKLGVSGPSPGIIGIIISAISILGSFQAFLVAVVIAGILQIIAGFFKSGIIGYYFPSSVIKGMLAAIGIVLILKEIPHALGYDADFMGDDAFFQKDHHNTFTELFYAIRVLSPGAIIISVISIAILLFFDSQFVKRNSFLKLIPGALVVVLIGIFLNYIFKVSYPSFYLKGNHMVSLPVMKTLSDLGTFFSFPDFTVLSNPNVYIVGATIALVGSLETLLSVEAVDKIDPDKNHTSKNRELIAQGVGNITSGLLGGLPITQVIVRSSANVTSGGKSKLSTILHGVLLAITVLSIPKLLNLIPLASLSAILLLVGYKLTKVDLFRQMIKMGYTQFLPFVVTIIAILLTDLLKGILVGIVVAIIFILKRNYENAFRRNNLTEENGQIEIVFPEQVTFINKGNIINMLNKLPNNGKVLLDGSNCKEMDFDVLEVIQEFKDYGSKNKNINLTIVGINTK